MTNSVKLNEEKLLQNIKDLQLILERELQSQRLQNINPQSTEEFEHSKTNGSFVDLAHRDISLAEVTTTVKSSLPKFFNRLLRKQNKVNRYIISALRNVVNSQLENMQIIKEKETETEMKLRDHSWSLIDLSTKVNELIGQVESDLHHNKNLAYGVEDNEFASFYLAYQNKFRGSVDEISKKLEVHVPIVVEAKNKSNEELFKAMDLGCGRGEWLSLLLEKGIEVIGVDSNPSLIHECKSKNLSVEEGDALTRLNDQTDNSLHFLSAFHLIEHLDFQSQFSLIKNAYRVLKPGGVFLYETPNVHNIDVGASGFFHDPTHIRPIHWTMGQFIADYVGFLPPEIKFLNCDPSFENDDCNKEEIKLRLHGPRDYALIAHKP
jgi:SAM-dependent methyltransferase